MKQEIKQRIEQIKNGEAPQGYKKTSLGVFPCSWGTEQLKNLGMFGKGKGIPGSQILDSGLQCVGYGDIYTKYNIAFDRAECFINKETAEESREYKKGVLLFSGTGETAIEIGKCVCYSGEENIFVGADIITFIPSNSMNSKFLVYQQNINNYIKQKARLGQGHSVVHIYSDSIKKIRCNFPILKEQEKIAEVLDVWGEAIELQQELIKKLEQRKKALMQKLLCVNKIEEIIRMKQIIVSSKKSNLQSSEGLKKGKYPFYINNSSEMTKFSNDYLFDGEYIIANTGGQGYFSYYNGKFSAMSDCFIFKIKNQNTRYIYYYLLNKLSIINKLGFTGSGLKHLDKKWFGNFKLILPSFEEQNKVADILSSMDEKIELEKNLLEKYKTQQQSLMQLLLTGIVRVEVKND